MHCLLDFQNYIYTIKYYSLASLLTFLFCMPISAAEKKYDDSLHGFFGDRFSLYPPTQEDSEAVVEIIQTFLNHLNNQNVTDAYFLDTGEDFKKATSFDKFKDFAHKFNGFDLQPKLDYHEVNFENNTKDKASYKLTLLGSNPSSKLYVEFNLIYEDQEWNIYSIKTYETPHRTIHF